MRSQRRIRLNLKTAFFVAIAAPMSSNKMFVVAIVATALSACGDTNRFTESLAKDALNKHLETANEITCRGGSGLQAALNSSHSTWRLITLTSKPGPAKGKGENGHLHLDLIDFGVVEMEKYDNGTFRGESPRLKSVGQGIRVRQVGAIEVPMLCAGKYSVDRVVKWTEPAINTGTLTSVVTFTVRPDQMEPWTKISTIQTLFLPKQLSGGIEQQLLLQKTNLGWEVAS